VRIPAFGLDEHQRSGDIHRYASDRTKALRLPGALPMDSTQLPNLVAAEKMSPRELATLVDDARALQRSAEAGAMQPLLRGRRFGLLDATGDAGKDDIALFDRAAIELGAQVAHIGPYLTELSAPREVDDTAHVLGRLYDAVVCQGMAPALVQRLSAEAGIPVYDGIASPSHPLAEAADLLGFAISAVDKRRFLLQALLVRSMA
jgi:ornithine carbamoyltransferase